MSIMTKLYKIRSMVTTISWSAAMADQTLNTFTESGHPGKDEVVSARRYMKELQQECGIVISDIETIINALEEK